MKTLKKVVISILVIFGFFTQTTLASDFLGKEKINDDLKGSELGLANVAENGIVFLVGFIYFIAVVYGIWGGFQILTARSDEEKVKKGRTVVIQALIGIAVILSASLIVDFFIGDKGQKGLLTDSEIE